MSAQNTVSGYPDNVDSADCTTDVVSSVLGAQLGWSSDTVCADRCMPLVGDLDGDGNPEIVCFSRTGESVYRADISRVSTILVYDGVTKNLKATITLPSPVTSYDATAYGLVKTSTGTGLIVVACYDYKLRAYDITSANPGTPYWVSDIDYGSSEGDWAVNIGFADFNMDGHPELYVRNKIYNAETGSLLVAAPGTNTGASYAHWTHESYWKLSSPMAADVYGDAKPELILGNQIYEISIVNTLGSSGNAATLAVQTNPPRGVLEDGHPQVADFNMDGHLDVFISVRTNYSRNSRVYGYVWDVYNNTTSSLISIYTNWSGKSIPLIADIDNDGNLEVIIQCGSSDNNKYQTYRYDPQTGSFIYLWGLQPDEDSYSNGITAFDFNQDGLLELLICDQSMVRIVNGSGKSHITHNDTVPVYVMASFPFSETTIMQYPVIADVDNDGHAEIVFVGNNRLNVLESSVSPWAPARRVWNQYMYNVTCVNEDLTVPQSQFNNAYVFTDPQGTVRRPYNNFLQQATTIDRYGRPFYAVPDLVMDSASVNYGDDSVTITFHYCNQGDNTVNAPYTCSVSAAGLTEPIYTDTIEAAMPMDSCGQGLLTIANSLLCGVADLDSVTVTLRTGGQPECDSTNNSVTVALHPTFRDTIAVSICDNQSYTFRDTSYNTSGYHSHLVHHTTGCDSIVYLHLSILPSPLLHHIPDTVILPGQSLTLHAGGADIYTWQNSSGTVLSNDSVTTVSPSASTTYYLTAFNQGGNLVYNGDFELGNTGFSTAYTYSSRFLSAGYYCVDTNAHNHHSGFTGSHDHTSGSGNYMMANGEYLIGTNVWTQVINVQPLTDYAFSVWGSNLSPYPEQAMAQLQFSINNVQLGDIHTIPTPLETWTQFYEVWNSGNNNVATLTISNLSTIAVGNDFGIDDIHFASLSTCQSSDTIHVYVGHHHDTTICQSQLPFLWNGVTFDHAGAKTATLTGQDGNDSLVIMNVIVIPTKNNTLYDTICNNHPFVQNGNAYSTTGVYTDTLVAASGCDSIVTLNLFALDTTVGDTVVNVCDSLTWHGTTYTATTDTPTHVTTNAEGCDSTTTLHLTVRYSTAGDTTAVVCDSLVWRDSTYRVTTTYVQYLTNAAGCDSTFTLNLTVNSSTVADTFAITPVIFMWHDSTYTLSTIDTLYLTTSEGCDSLTVLHLTVSGYPDNVDSADCTTDVVSSALGAQVGWSSDTVCADRCMPLVGDLDGDGNPEIVCFSRTGESVYRADISRVSTILVYDGVTKNLKATITLPSPVTSYDATAYGLVKTSTGTGLIVVACYDYKLRAYDITSANPGTPYWVSDINYGGSAGDWAVNIGFADFNMDGHPEVYVRNKIYNAETGNLLVSVSSSNTGASYAHWSHDTYWKLSSPMASDVYGDAKPELILGNEAYGINITNTSGSIGNAATLVRQTAPPSGIADGHPQVADFNMDGHLDVFISVRTNYSRNSRVYGYVWDVYNNTTSSLISIYTNWSGKSIPLIADIDNDGNLEVIIQCGSSDNNKYQTYRYDPQTGSFTYLWGLQPDEDSYSNSITAFDFNQDGLLELLICDQSMVRIVNGSGKSHITQNDTIPVYAMATFPFSETTIMQYPVIVDVDNDGHAEIVFVGNNRLNVLESSVSPWAPARRVWNQYMYNVTCVNEDLTVPQSQFNNAYVFTDPQGTVRRPYNNFLQQATTIDRYGRPFYAVPDLVMDSASVAYGEDSVTITYHYCNEGDNTVNAPYTCSVSAAGIAEPLYTDTIATSMAKDSCTEGQLRLSNSLLCVVAGLDSVTVTLRTGGQPECDTTNNSVKVAVHPTFRDTVAASICDNQPYAFWDTAYSTAGYHGRTVHNTVGCDTLHTLDLSVRATTVGDTTANVCDSLVWHGTTYTATTDTPTHVTTNAEGCDSTTTLHLTVRYSTAGDTTAVVCDSLVWRDSTYRVTTTYVQYLTNAAGCDSTSTLNLTVNYGDSITLNFMACDSYTWDADGNTYTSDTSLTAVLGNSSGCDSIVYLHLRVLPSPVLHHIPDTVISLGQSLDLHARGADIYTWQDASGAVLSNDSVITVSPSISTVFYLTAFNQGGNSIYNGDFELGNTGFSTAYNYSTDLFPEGNYYVGTNASTYHAGFTGPHDHTSGFGNYMIVNGASGVGTNLWTQVINVQPHTDYAFSVWGTNLSSYSQQYMAQLQFSVNNVQLGDVFQLPTTMETWTQFYEVWNSGNNNTVTLTILNMNTLLAGNDFGIDDIYFASLTTCQSSDTIHVYVGHHHDTIICQSQLPFLWNGVTFDHAGAKTATLTGQDGNDSLVIMNVIIIPTKNNTLYDTICNNHPFVQNGNAYSTTGVYTDTLVAASGCDSIVTLNLFALDTTVGDTVVNVCDTFTWYGTTYTATTNTPTHLSTNAVGCDSTTTLHLTVRHSTTGDTTANVCDSFTWWDSTYTATTNTPTHSSINAVGCDSTTTLLLTVRYSNTGDTTASVCDSLTWYGTTYTTTTNIPTHHSTNVAGCDSTTTLLLTVRYSNTGDTTANVCDSLSWYGTTYTATTNTPTHQSTNATGCDSTTTLLLTVRYSTIGDTVASVCDSLNWYGTTYTASTNTPTHLSINAANCDSTTTLHLTVRYSTTGDTTANACDTFIWHNQTYTQSNNQATHTYTNSANCDSTVTLHLTVRHSTASTYYDTVIENLLPRSFNGHSFTNDTANVLVTIPNAVGCDSNITYNLHVHHNVFVVVDSNLCNDSLPITWNDVVFDTLVSQTATMNQSAVLTAVTGADSTVQMNLYVHALYDHHQYEEICDKQTFAFGDSVYASTGDYSDTLRSIHGCDSLSTLHLVVHDTYEQRYADTICHNVTYEWRGHTVHSTADNLTENFILRDSLYSVQGCDSVIILTLTKMALPSIAFTADTDCSIAGYRLSVSATAPLSAGEEPGRMPYLHWTASPRDNSLVGQESSDTVRVSPLVTTKYILYADYHKTPLCPATDSITLDRIIVPKAILKVNPTTLSLDNLHFVAQDKTQSYHTHSRWYLDGMMYPGAGSIFEGDADPEADSVTIGLEVENGQCRDTAEMTLVINKVIIYVPNIFTPLKEDNNIFRIVTRGITEGELFIYDRVGNLVFHTNDLSQGWDGTHEGQPCQQRAYVWKLRFRTVEQPDADQSKTGIVTLLK